MGMACVRSLLAVRPSPSCLKALLASRPALPPSRRRTGGRVDRPGVASRCLLGAFSSSSSVLLGLAVHRVYVHLASSPGALLGLATRVSPSLTLSAGRLWPRLVDRFGDIVAGRGGPFSLPVFLDVHLISAGACGSFPPPVFRDGVRSLPPRVSARCCWLGPSTSSSARCMPS